MRLAYVFPFALVMACSGGSSLFQGTGGGGGSRSTFSSGAGSNACVAGQQRACACAGSAPDGGVLEGVQVCGPGGGSYGVCEGCGGGTGGGSSGTMSSSSGISSSTGSSSTGSSSSGISSSSGGPCAGGGPNVDMDGDSYTPAQGDCNDCDPNVNPGAVELFNAIDDNCDGLPDNVQPTCDAALTLDSMDPMSAAQAVDLCKVASGGNVKDWGVLTAQWMLPDGSNMAQDATTGAAVNIATSANFHLGHGMLSGFGPNAHPQAGSKLLALSSGTARAPTDPGYQAVSGFDKGYSSAAPQGFPKESPACPGIVSGGPHDGAAVELTIRPPTNGHAFSFDFIFYTYEWPGYICSTYNDLFIAFLTPIPAGQTDGNVTFDAAGNPVSVNNALLDVCGCASNPPCMAGSGPTKSFACSLGTSLLLGTGFDKASDASGVDHAATGWLRTTVPTQAGQPFKIRWAAYDSGDGVLDSSVLVDNFQWLGTSVAKPETVSIAKPK